MQGNEFEEVVRRARGAGPVVTIGVVVGALAALWAGYRLLRFGMRVAPALSTVATVVGLALWLREQLADLDLDRDRDRDDPYA